jgi:hypothetical protein
MLFDRDFIERSHPARAGKDVEKGIIVRCEINAVYVLNIKICRPIKCEIG